jgi:tyrosine-protein kinase Etk/Wzc
MQMNQPAQPMLLYGSAPPAVEQGEPVDVRNCLSFIFDNRRFIAVTVLLVTLLGTLYAFCAKPVYEASILIQVKDGTDTPSSILGERLSNAFDLKTAASAEIEVLRSRMVASEAVNEARLYIDVRPDYFPVIGAMLARFRDDLSRPGLFGLGGYVWGAERAGISMLEVPAELEGSPFTLIALGNGSFRMFNQAQEGIEVRGRVGEFIRVRAGSGVIALRIDRLHAQPGASFSVTRLPKFEAIQKLQEALKIQEKGKQSGVIGVNLEGDNKEKIKNILQAVGHGYIGQNEARKSEEAEKSLAFLDLQLPKLKQELEQSETRYNDFRNRYGTIDLGEEARTSLQQSVTAQTKLSDLRQRKEDLLIRFQNEHPAVSSVNQQINVVQAEMNALTERIKKLPSIEQEALRLARDVKVNTDLYTSLLGTAQQLRLVSATRVGNVRLLDPPMVPTKPVKPWKSLLILLSMMIGAVLGVVGALLRRSLCRRINHPHEIEQRLGMRVAAIVPHNDHSPALIHVDQRRSSEKYGAKVGLPMPFRRASGNVIESMRRFRTSFQSLMADNSNNIVVITGPTPGVGKSFVAANFAMVLAASRKRVILVDGDLRTGYLYRYFGVQRRRGLADLLMGDVTLEQTVHKEGISNRADFLQAGVLGQEDPGELLAGDNFAALLRKLSSDYDFVLIDTAPVLDASDALTIAPYAGATFNVVRAGVSTVDEIEETVRQLSMAGVEVTGTVFNDLKPGFPRYGFAARYGRYGRYGYATY